jgi:hypothetical protein
MLPGLVTAKPNKTVMVPGISSAFIKIEVLAQRFARLTPNIRGDQ